MGGPLPFEGGGQEAWPENQTNKLSGRASGTAPSAQTGCVRMKHYPSRKTLLFPVALESNKQRLL